MTHTEKVALAMAWYDSGLEDRAAFQTLMESLFAQPEQEPCVHAKNPKGCYRVRCQLGDKCVDDEMSFRTTPPQRQPLTHDELSDIWFKQSTDWMEFARAIEAAHGIKENT